MIVVATYHKSGTVWMSRIFQEIGSFLNLKLHRLEQGAISDPGIYEAFNSLLPPELLEHNFRGLHLIRDPRDIVLSGLYYHMSAKEPWLHAPRRNLGGNTYQQTLLSLGPDEQLYFEMNQMGRWIVSKMLDWNYEDERFFEAKYEDLISANGAVLFREILQFLGIEGNDVGRCLEIFERNSLHNRGFVASPFDPHVRSGRPRQWETGYCRRHGERFREILGDCLVQLGYEVDDCWIDRLPE